MTWGWTLRAALTETYTCAQCYALALKYTKYSRDQVGAALIGLGGRNTIIDWHEWSICLEVGARRYGLFVFRSDTVGDQFINLRRALLANQDKTQWAGPPNEQAVDKLNLFGILSALHSAKPALVVAVSDCGACLRVRLCLMICESCQIKRIFYARHPISSYAWSRWCSCSSMTIYRWF
jgi:hypothetical protein